MDVKEREPEGRARASQSRRCHVKRRIRPKVCILYTLEVLWWKVFLFERRNPTFFATVNVQKRAELPLGVRGRWGKSLQLSLPLVANWQEAQRFPPLPRIARAKRTR